MKKRSALYYKAQIGTPSKGSPNQLAWGLVKQGLKKGAKYFWPAAGTADTATKGEYTTDWPEGTSDIEKILRTADDWLTLGIGGTIYDASKTKKSEEQKKRDKDYYERTKFGVGTPKI